MNFKVGDLLKSIATGRIIKYEGGTSGVVVNEDSISSGKMGIGARSDYWSMNLFELYEEVGFEF